MVVLLDTGFYFALLVKRDKYHIKAQEILQEIAEGTHGRIYTTDYIMDETLTLLNVRTQGKRKDLLEKMLKLFVGEEPIATLLKIEVQWLEEIAQTQKKMTKEHKPISFTDCSTMVLAKKQEIQKIVSFDSHFRGILEHIE